MSVIGLIGLRCERACHDGRIVSVQSEGSLGTGFVVKANGWIATNLHVVERGGDITVAFSNGRKLPAYSRAASRACAFRPSWKRNSAAIIC